VTHVSIFMLPYLTAQMKPNLLNLLNFEPLDDSARDMLSNYRAIPPSN